MYNYIVDWEEFKLIEKLVRPGDTVFDVGANMGFYTIWMSRFIGPGGHIHSFEPDNNNFKRLKENVQLNKLSKIAHLNNAAVGDHDGEVGFTKGLDGENHITINGRSETVAVAIKKLDSYVNEKNIERIRYCKIDVEGFEFAVLEGALELLSMKRIDVLQLEINDKLDNANVSVADLLSLLNQKSYCLCSFNVKQQLLERVSYEIGRENYFAVSDLDKINAEIFKSISVTI